MNDAPRARRHPLFLRADQAVLVVVDFQERLVATVDEPQRAETVRCLRVWLQAARTLRLPVLVTEQYRKGLGPTDASIGDLLPGEAPLDKVVFDCCGAAGFRERLAATGRRQVLLAGMEAHICVLQTALGLLADGWPVWVARDAVCSRRVHNRDAGLDLLRGAGAVVAPTETLLFMLLERAGTPEFKELSALIR